MSPFSCTSRDVHFAGSTGLQAGECSALKFPGFSLGESGLIYAREQPTSGDRTRREPAAGGKRPAARELLPQLLRYARERALQDGLPAVRLLHELFRLLLKLVWHGASRPCVRLASAFSLRVPGRGLYRWRPRPVHPPCLRSPWPFPPIRRCARAALRPAR